MIAKILAKTVSVARARALKEIQGKFKSEDRIVIDGRKKLRIDGGFGVGSHTVREIQKNGEVHCWNMPQAVTVLHLDNLSTENVIKILAELESK